MRHTWTRTVLAGLAAVMAVGLAACGGDTPATPAPGSSPAITGDVTVFAASSLTDSFKRIGGDFEAAHPGTKVIFNFGGSSTLAAQIAQGAPADVFAAASPATMKTTADTGGVEGAPTVFVKNQLVIAVPKGNPKGIGTLENLTRPDLKVALCAEAVPCGAAAKKAIDAAGLKVTPVTLEPDVRGTLSKVRLGEADAALVYRTDAQAAAADVDGIEFPESAKAINDYPIAVLKNAPNRTAAQAFLDYVLSEQGRTVLVRAGFQAP